MHPAWQGRSGHQQARIRRSTCLLRLSPEMPGHGLSACLTVHAWGRDSWVRCRAPVPSQSRRTRFLNEMAAAWRVPMATLSSTATRSRFTSCPGECWNCARAPQGTAQPACTPPCGARPHGRAHTLQTAAAATESWKCARAPGRLRPAFPPPRGARLHGHAHAASAAARATGGCARAATERRAHRLVVFK